MMIFRHHGANAFNALVGLGGFVVPKLIAAPGQIYSNGATLIKAGWDLANTNIYSQIGTGIVGVGITANKVSPLLPESVVTPTADTVNGVVDGVLHHAGTGITLMVDKIGVPVLGKTTEVVVESTFKAAGKVLTTAVETTMKSTLEFAKKPELTTIKLCDHNASANTMGLVEYAISKLPEVDQELAVQVGIVAGVALLVVGTAVAGIKIANYLQIRATNPKAEPEKPTQTKLAEPVQNKKGHKTKTVSKKE